MEILFITERERLSVRVGYELDSLLKHGHSVHVVYFVRRKQAKPPGSSKPCRETRIHVRAPWGTPWLLGITPLLYTRLLWTLRHERPQVVHCTHLFLLPLSLLLARLKGAKLVYDAYELHAIAWSNYLARYASIVRPLIEAIENRLVAHADCILTIDTLDDMLACRYRRVNPCVVVLENVPPLNVQTQQSKLPTLREAYHGQRILVYVGLLHKDKGLAVALQALKLTRERFKKDVTLLLIGLDESASAQTLIQSFGLNSHAKILPWLDYEEMFQYLRVAYVGLALYQRKGHFLFSRRNARKLFTYMHAGLPIIAPDFGQLGQIVVEEGCGLLVDTSDPIKVADAVGALLADPEGARLMGEQGRRAIEKKYNWELEQAKLIAAYTSLYNGLASHTFGTTGG